MSGAQRSRPLAGALTSLCASALLAAACGDAPGAAVDFERLLDDGEALYSQGKEEVIVRHFFRDERGGFFVDVGAYDWRELSTTLYLEEKLGWRGLAIDANDEHAAGYAAHRPNTRFVSVLVTKQTGGSETFHVAVGASGVSSRDRQWILDFWRDFFPNYQPPEIRKITVPNITLDDLLEQQDVAAIDFLSMDIEGAELDALSGFSIQRFQPRLVCIEASKKNRDAIHAYFVANGYARIDAYRKYDEVNWYYRPAAAPDRG